MAMRRRSLLAAGATRTTGESGLATEAVLELARLIHAPGSWLQLLKVIPRPWRDGAYSLLSRHRHRLFGKRDTCLLPQPEWRGRFLEQP